MDRLKCALGFYSLCAHGRIACFHMKNMRWRKMQSFSMWFPFSAHIPHFLHFFTTSKLFHLNAPATHAHNCLLNDLKKIALYLHSPWVLGAKTKLVSIRSIYKSFAWVFFCSKWNFSRKQRLSERRLSIIIYELHYLIHAAKYFHFDKIHNSQKWHVFTLNVLSATQYVYTHWFANYSPLKCVN